MNAIFPRILNLSFIAAIMIVLSCTPSVNGMDSQKESPCSEYHEGYYIYGHEANTFQPCGSEKIYWVVGADEVVGELTKKYYGITSDPYEEVYVKLNGSFGPKATDGFAADFDGTFTVTGIVAVEKKPPVDCVKKK